jgi:hypothetical protein
VLTPKDGWNCFDFTVLAVLIAALVRAGHTHTLRLDCVGTSFRDWKTRTCSGRASPDPPNAPQVLAGHSDEFDALRLLRRAAF